ncbi:MAG: CRISPR-associated endonuclease Cas1 [Xanthomonadales bacterium]|nr:CRISPR-associated endonuclease Cas1 [Xanthomonadales bacterium]
MSHTLTIDRGGCRLDHQGEALIVRRAGTIERSVPMHRLERVVLYASTELTSGLLALLAERGIGLVAYGGRFGERFAQILGVPHNDARIRAAQARLAADWGAARQLAAKFVLLKVRAQRRLLARALGERPDLRKPLLDAVATVDRVLASLREVPEDRDRLLGFEGAASAAYFAGYAALFPPSLGFRSRERRPPPDPINAALSLGYTLLVHAAARAAQAVGLDPMIGFLHAFEHGRPALACDLAEAARPRVDRIVWTLFRERRLTADHFRRGHDGCLLGKAGRAIFYDALLPRLAAIERHLRAEARHIARRLANPENPR